MKLQLSCWKSWSNQRISVIRPSKVNITTVASFLLILYLKAQLWSLTLIFMLFSADIYVILCQLCLRFMRRICCSVNQSQVQWKAEAKQRKSTLHFITAVTFHWNSKFVSNMVKKSTLEDEWCNRTRLNDLCVSLLFGLQPMADVGCYFSDCSDLPCCLPAWTSA